MDHERAEQPTAEQLTEIGADVSRSVVAGLVGMAVAGLLVWLVLRVMHPSGWYALIGIPTACSIIPGLVIGLLDRRRPLITAPLAAFLFYLVLLLVQTRGDIGTDGWVAAAALGAGFLAGLGAFVGSSVRQVRYGGVTTVALVAAAFVVAFVFPELAFRRDADRFVAQHLDEVVALVGEDLVRMPDAELQWNRKLVGGLFRGVELSTGWRAGTQTAGAGQCTLTVRTRWLKSEGELDDDIDTIRFRFTPDSPVRLKETEEAAALLQELGATDPPEGLEKRPTSGWHAWWRPERKGRARPIYEVTARYDGEATVKRDIPWLD